MPSVPDIEPSQPQCKYCFSEQVMFPYTPPDNLNGQSLLLALLLRIITNNISRFPAILGQSREQNARSLGGTSRFGGMFRGIDKIDLGRKLIKSMLSAKGSIPSQAPLLRLNGLADQTLKTCLVRVFCCLGCLPAATTRRAASTSQIS